MRPFWTFAIVAALGTACSSGSSERAEPDVRTTTASKKSATPTAAHSPARPPSLAPISPSTHAASAADERMDAVMDSFVAYAQERYTTDEEWRRKVDANDPTAAAEFLEMLKRACHDHGVQLSDVLGTKAADTGWERTPAR